MKPRTRARSVALQVLYEADLVDHLPGAALEAQLEENPLDDKLSEFSRIIVQGVFPLKTSLDAFIAEHAPEWPLDQMAVIDRNILRIAIFEFLIEGETPVKVAINEAVELAKKKFTRVLTTQIWGKGWKQEKLCASYNEESWRVGGMLDRFSDPAHSLVFDRRNEQRESALVKKMKLRD